MRPISLWEDFDPCQVKVDMFTRNSNTTRDGFGCAWQWSPILCETKCSHVSTASEIARKEMLDLRNKTSAPLLKLPRELRDMIYEHALTFGGEELYCRSGSLSLELLDEKKQVQQPNNQQKVQRYIESPINLRLYLTQKDEVEANQLKYVCRQLHQDTSGLELAYNTIVFFGEVNRYDKMVQCSRFLYHCGKQWKSRLRRMILRDEIHPEPETTTRDFSLWLFDKDHPLYGANQSIAQFTVENPKATVHLHLGQSYAPPHVESVYIFILGLLVSWYGRGTLSSVVTSPGNLHLIFREGWVDKILPGMAWLAQTPNYRLFPHHASFEPLELRAALSAPASLLSGSLPPVVGDVDTWMAFYKSYYDEGL
ncbi:hypothetical protein BDV96DRAFT_682119 [Lophiotrema nucula]|uniref:Uncharacterized protein n=1 Tax=Lophiotrema nucula TaxID=690887 RepID=A0A6A5ZUV3_9PLEO|nr:hypothetical protein BDV96DRAFT_682119 [Lophiotrema nucula]